VGNSPADVLIRFVYWIDAPTNLFPSIHCLVSWMCFIGVRGKSYVPKWYQIFSCLFAVAVFASTLFTKQHFIVDVIAGVVIAELCYYISCHTKIYCWVEKQFDRLNQKVFGEKWDEE
jgi:membrane-associated phospholipid phosphatase